MTKPTRAQLWRVARKSNIGNVVSRGVDIYDQIEFAFTLLTVKRGSVSGNSPTFAWHLGQDPADIKKRLFSVQDARMACDYVHSATKAHETRGEKGHKSNLMNAALFLRVEQKSLAEV
jgi:hypothetical protein